MKMTQTDLTTAIWAGTAVAAAAAAGRDDDDGDEAEDDVVLLAVDYTSPTIHIYNTFVKLTHRPYSKHARMHTYCLSNAMYSIGQNINY